MTFKKFKKDLLGFIRNSNVNLGRETTRTRADFLEEIESMCTAFETDEDQKAVVKAEETKSDDGDNIICMKPKNKKRALDIGKGVVAMTGSESQRADEELNRSPYNKKLKNKE